MQKNRHRSDRQVNNRKVNVLINGKLISEKWMNVQVGDIIKLENNQFVTADLLLLSSSEPLNIVYIETAELDGETNLKVKQALTVTGDMGDYLEALAAFNGEVYCEPPNNRLDRFMGTLTFGTQKYSLDNERVLLRGCTLRNTDWCFGLVLFAGPETKLMQNCGKSTFKRTSIDRLMNVLVLFIFGLLALMCIILAVGNGIWENHAGSKFNAFLPREENTGFSAFLTFWSYIIILNTVVPISLYVSMEVIRLGNSYYINWDRNMYHARTDTPAEARTTTLNEELGQIKYIFSDKTGTLTQNIMTFNKCSINGKSYGDVIDHYSGQRLEITEEMTPVDFSFNRLADPKFIRIRNPEGKLSLYCKGADTIIYERLHPSCSELMKVTTEHLNEFAGEGLRTLVLAYKDLDEEYFSEWKQRHHESSVALEDREENLEKLYEEIEKDMMLIGATAIEDKLQDGVSQTIEQLTKAEIKIWVLTGDKQETAENIGYSCNLLREEMNDVFFVAANSPEEVRQELRDARLKMRPATEQDKFLIPEIILGDTPKVVQDENVNGDYGLVINGHSLAFALESNMELEFLRTACMCKTVICCRVTPLQKAQVVELVKKYKKAVTLAIGDGANDVSMIKAAHIGVGISGQEGMQAVLSSDFSFAQFRFLQRLLLVHGRWSYLRMCKFLRYFFYKNFTFTFVHFWYAFFCGFSAQTVYDEGFITLYNLVYTALPVLGMSLFDQDVNAGWSLEYPQLYVPGQLSQYFSKRDFMMCALHSCYSSLVLFFVPYAATYDTARDDGKDGADYQSFALITQTCLTVTVCVQLGLDLSYWTVVNHLYVWGSLGMFFILTFTMYTDGLFRLRPSSFAFIGTARNCLNQPNVWLTVALTAILCVLPVVAYRFFYSQISPTINDKVRYKVRQMKEPTPRPRRTRLTRRSTRRSGYAFSHAHGYGDLVTSGRFLRRHAPARSMGLIPTGRSPGFKPTGRSAGYSPVGQEQNPKQKVEPTSLQMFRAVKDASF
ncbi:phospholipid-transporting ATPase ID-like [Sinocyclocheilus rhinocerous]|uniref:phospholipid-transporting ATPase ID-like n=1 Tax=Sinocyclocheilus rhinocerous TaxID=307959 RepID=UPI0007BABE29|nr:PREDICTED: phospholipid-transporting ATPase ID-like [Sinocyclocheilus rhinocerous]